MSGSVAMLREAFGTSMVDAAVIFKHSSRGFLVAIHMVALSWGQDSRFSIQGISYMLQKQKREKNSVTYANFVFPRKTRPISAKSGSGSQTQSLTL